MSRLPRPPGAAPSQDVVRVWPASRSRCSDVPRKAIGAPGTLSSRVLNALNLRWRLAKRRGGDSSLRTGRKPW
eukprot:9529364-Alexandrium_andersonii.AAC.1